MKKTLKVVFIICLVVLIKLVLSFSINEIVIANYNKNVYNSSLIKSLYLFNFNEPYIVYYNEGNILYRTGKYSDAKEKYEKALKKRPSKKNVCDIRINLSLSIIKQIDSTDSKKAYEQLEEAKNNLYKDNCASASHDNGSSKDAEELEEQIEELQKELGDSSEGEEQDDQNKDNEDEENEGKDELQNLEEQLKEIEKEANADRQSDLDSYEAMKDTTFYSGKTW